MAASVCAAGYSLFALRHAFDAPRIRLTLDLRRLAATSLGVAIALGCSTVINSIDVLTVKHYFDARQAGLFAIVSLAGKGLAYTLAFVPTVVLPKATIRALRSLSVHGILLQAVAGLLALAVPGLLVMFFFAPFVVRLVGGPAYVDAAPMLFPYAFAMVLLALTSVVVTFKIGLHRFDFVAPLLIVTIGEVVALNLNHHTLGAIIATLIVGNLIACSRRSTGSRPRWRGASFTTLPAGEVA